MNIDKTNRILLSKSQCQSRLFLMRDFQSEIGRLGCRYVDLQWDGQREECLIHPERRKDNQTGRNFTLKRVSLTKIPSPRREK